MTPICKMVGAGCKTPNAVVPISLRNQRAGLAQLVEQRFCKPDVPFKNQRFRVKWRPDVPALTRFIYSVCKTISGAFLPPSLRPKRKSK